MYIVNISKHYTLYLTKFINNQILFVLNVYDLLRLEKRDKT